MNFNIEIQEGWRFSNPPGYFNFWLICDGIPVVMVSGVYEAKTGFWLHDIETRKKFRNQGLSAVAFDKIKAHFHINEIKHDGGYTPDGFDFIMNKLSRPSSAEKVCKARFNQMDFVHSWEDRQVLR